MKTYIDIIHDFQLLESRARMGVPLYEQEEAERSGLEALLRGDAHADLGLCAWPRIAAGMAARFSHSRGFGTARLHDISGGGLALTFHPASAPAMGTDLLVYLDDSTRGLRYVFPVRVAWCDANRGRLGARFSDIPSRVSITDARPRSITPSGVFIVRAEDESESPTVVLVGEGR